MWHQFRQTVARLMVVVCLGVGLALVGVGYTPPAFATIRQLKEAPGQFLYQSRQTLRDQQGRNWQTIAFKRIKPDGITHFYLRLVGFPGTVEVDRSRPLQITNSLGQTLTAPDASSQIFTDATAPEPNVAQYDLELLLAKLQPELPLHLNLPTTDGTAVVLQVPPNLLQEWKILEAANGQQKMLKKNSLPLLFPAQKD